MTTTEELRHLVGKLRAMPSSLNDACRTMESAADEIERLSAPAQRALDSDTIATLTPDEEHPDCSTKREFELYHALIGLASAVMARRREWDNWVQGGVKVAPIVRRALRLDGSQFPSTMRATLEGDGK